MMQLLEARQTVDQSFPRSEAEMEAGVSIIRGAFRGQHGNAQAFWESLNRDAAEIAQGLARERISRAIMRSDPRIIDAASVRAGDSSFMQSMVALAKPTAKELALAVDRANIGVGSILSRAKQLFPLQIRHLCQLAESLVVPGSPDTALAAGRYLSLLNAYCCDAPVTGSAVEAVQVDKRRGARGAHGALALGSRVRLTRPLVCCGESVVLPAGTQGVVIAVRAADPAPAIDTIDAGRTQDGAVVGNVSAAPRLTVRWKLSVSAWPVIASRIAEAARVVS